MSNIIKVERCVFRGPHGQLMSIKIQWVANNKPEDMNQNINGEFVPNFAGNRITYG